MTKYGHMLQAYEAQARQTFCSYSPLHLYIEPTNVCNLACSHCPHRIMRRELGYMNLQLYQRAIHECRNLGIEWVYLFHLGEAALHREIAAMIAIARVSGVKTRLHTNGTRDVSNLEPDALYISANETPFGKMQRNIDKLIERGRCFKIVAIDAISHAITQEYHEYLDRKSYHNWHGAVAYAESGDILCSHPYKAMCILWNGLVVPCCADYDGHFVVGDFRSASLEEIWNGPRMQAIRERLAPMCNGCNVERVPVPEHGTAKQIRPVVLQSSIVDASECE